MVLSKLSYLPINSHLAVSNKGLLDTGRFRELGKMPDFAHFQRNHSLNWRKSNTTLSNEVNFKYLAWRSLTVPELRREPVTGTPASEITSKLLLSVFSKAYE